MKVIIMQIMAALPTQGKIPHKKTPANLEWPCDQRMRTIHNRLHNTVTQVVWIRRHAFC